MGHEVSAQVQSTYCVKPITLPDGGLVVLCAGEANSAKTMHVRCRAISNWDRLVKCSYCCSAVC